MTELEKEREIEKSERSKIRESIKLRKEKEKVGAFEKPTIECPECGTFPNLNTHTSVLVLFLIWKTLVVLNITF